MQNFSIQNFSNIASQEKIKIKLKLKLKKLKKNYWWPISLYIRMVTYYTENQGGLSCGVYWFGQFRFDSDNCVFGQSLGL